MPKNNPYYIKNETQKPIERSLDGFNKPFEAVYELKKDEYQVPSFEKFMKTYERNEKVENSYKGEFTDRDKVPSYGPGSSQSNYSDNREETRRERYLGKATVGFASGAVTKFAGPAPGVIYGTTVKAVSEIGHALSSSDEAKDAWKYASDLGGDIAMGAVGGGIADQLGEASLGNCSCDLVREGWEVWSQRGGKEKFQMDYHDFHLTRGENYSSYCSVCKS